MPTRAERRAAAREAAKQLLQHPPKKKRFRWDYTLGCVGVAIGILIVLAPPKTRLSAGIWLVILFGVLVYPVLHLGEWIAPTKPKWLAGGSILLLAIATLGFGRAVMPSLSLERKLSCQIETVQFDTFYRFFQDPPVYFQRLDTAVRVSLTNQLGKPVYLTGGYSAAALRGTQWTEFKNADSAAFEPYAFGVMVTIDGKPMLRRFDLSVNGFDYVMQQGPLKADESKELWMFFISGLSRKELPDISQFRFAFRDSAGEDLPCNCAYSIKADRGTVVGINRGDLKAMPFEPVPQNLREEPPH